MNNALNNPCHEGMATDTPLAALRRLNDGLWVIDDEKGRSFVTASGNTFPKAIDAAAVSAFLPPLDLCRIGAAFCRAHGVRYPLYAGSMAHGIASESLVIAMAEAGMLGFFGAAGESPQHIEAILIRMKETLSGKPFGFNLINSPNNPAWEKEVVDVYLRQGLPLIEASAYLMLSPALIKYRVKGLFRDAQGVIRAPNRIIAKVSRAEIAERFLSPPPEKILRRLVESGEITAEEASLAASIPVAEDITAEADSGGHTDHRAALAMLPGLLRLRDTLQMKYGYAAPPRIGLAGGIATPHAVAAAFSMGADYVVTGSVNQACVESGVGDTVRAMLARASQTDVAHAPAADMFEMGVTVQVLKKGTRFAERASKLYEYYRRYASLEDIPEIERQKMVDTIFRAPLADIWEETAAFFARRDPAQLAKAAADPRHKMALIFRWYLGQASRWANEGTPGREEDYQIWCGPAMGAFNDWVRGSFMEAVEERRAALVGYNLLFHGAVVMRAAALRGQGGAFSLSAEMISPLRKEELKEYWLSISEGVSL